MLVAVSSFVLALALPVAAPLALGGSVALAPLPALLQEGPPGHEQDDRDRDQVRDPLVPVAGVGEGRG